MQSQKLSLSITYLHAVIQDWSGVEPKPHVQISHQKLTLVEVEFAIFNILLE